MVREVVVLSGVRTAIGTFGGSLKDIPPSELGALVVREAVKRAGISGEDVGHVVIGNVIIPNKGTCTYRGRCGQCGIPARQH